MSNIYFPDEQIGYNELYFVCYMIERTARVLHQHNRYVVDCLGMEGLKRQLSIADTNHCLNPNQVVSDWIEEYQLTAGDFDITAVDPNWTDKVPSDTQMGKVYARLILAVMPSDEELVETIQAVYASSLAEKIDNYNSSAYYEPSYVQARAYLNGGAF